MVAGILSSFSSRGISALNSSLKGLEKTFAQLASGMRINSSADDAAGLAVASELLSSSNLEGQSLRNIADAQSALNIADGATQQIDAMNARRSELAMQAANGTYSDAQRATMQQEFNQLGQEMQRITQTTEFNGTKLLDGGSISVQVGTDGSAASSLSVGGLTLSDALQSAGSLDISTQAGAQAALTATQTFSQTLNTQRTSGIGAAQSRLSAASEVISESRISKTEASSRIMDADIANTTAMLSQLQVQSLSSIAMIAQTKNLNAMTVKLLLG